MVSITRATVRAGGVPASGRPSVRRACRGRHRDVVRRRHRPGRLQAAGEPRPAHRTWGRSLAKACPCARMLPLIVTVCLSGVRAMASGKAIVRRLDAIETLGGMDVLCVDKTGTPTSGVIKLDRAQSVSGLNSSYVLHAAWLTTLIPHTTSNPWDDAIVAVEQSANNIPATYRSREARLSIRYDAGRPSSSRRAITTRTASTQVAAISVRPAAPAPERPGTSAASWSSRTPSPKCCPLRHRHAQWNRRAADRSTTASAGQTTSASNPCTLEVQHPCWSCNSNSSSANASAGVR